MKNISSPKIRLVLSLSLLLLAAISCQKLVGLLNFKISDSTNFTIPATGLVMNTAVALPGIAVSSNSSSTYAGNNTTADYVQDVTLDKLTLTTTDPARKRLIF